MENETSTTQQTDYKELVVERRANIVSEIRGQVEHEKNHDKECSLHTVFYYAGMSLYMTERRAELLAGNYRLAISVAAEVLGTLDMCVANGLLDDAKKETFCLNTYAMSIVNHMTGETIEEGVELTADQQDYIKQIQALDDDVRAELFKMLMSVCVALYRLRYEHWTNAQMLQHIEHPENLTELIDPVVTYAWARGEGIRVDFYVDLEHIELSEEEEAAAFEQIDMFMKLSEFALTEQLKVMNDEWLPASREWIEQFLVDHKEIAQRVFCSTMVFYGLIPNRGFDINEKLFDKEWMSELFDKMRENYFGAALRPEIDDAELRPGFIYAMFVSLFVNSFSEHLGKPLLCGRGEAVDNIIHCSAEAVNKKAGITD